MIIRQSQMEEFERRAVKNFRTRVAAYLRTHLSDRTATMDNANLDDAITDAQTQAEEYGVVSERGIAKWCYLYLALGSTFHTQPTIDDYLRRDVSRPDEKVDSLMRALAIRLEGRERET